MRLRPALRSWCARWLSPRFVWPEARHEMRRRRRSLTDQTLERAEIMSRCRFEKPPIRIVFLPVTNVDLDAPTAAELDIGVDLAEFTAPGIVTSDLRGAWTRPRPTFLGEGAHAIGEGT